VPGSQDPPLAEEDGEKLVSICELRGECYTRGGQDEQVDSRAILDG
jgi:hypothetical protein